MELRNEIKAVADTEGIDFFGVADLSPAHDAILAQGGLTLPVSLVPCRSAKH